MSVGVHYLNDLAVGHDTHAGRKRHGLLLIVGHDDERHTELLWMLISSNWVCSRSFDPAQPGAIQQQQLRR